MRGGHELIGYSHGTLTSAVHIASKQRSRVFRHVFMIKFTNICKEQNEKNQWERRGHNKPICKYRIVTRSYTKQCLFFIIPHFEAKKKDKQRYEYQPI